MQKIQIYTRVNQSVEGILQQHHLTATRSTFSPQAGKIRKFSSLPLSFHKDVCYFHFVSQNLRVQNTIISTKTKRCKWELNLVSVI